MVRDACVSAATKLSITDPEEADANAIFAAVKEYDNLLSKSEFCEVITVSGLFERGVMGDKKIRNQVAEVLKGYPADSAVLVSDGIEGEELAPVIQSLVPIVSIRKVIVKHSRSVEESYQVLGRYLRMLVFDSRYAKYALGVPGIIFVALVLTSYFFPNADTPLILVIFIGIVFIIRGFDIDRRIESIGKLSATGYLRLFSVIASVLIVLVGIATGVAAFFPIGTAGICAPTATACNLAKEVSKTPSVFPECCTTDGGVFHSKLTALRLDGICNLHHYDDFLQSNSTRVEENCKVSGRTFRVGIAVFSGVYLCKCPYFSAKQQ